MVEGALHMHKGMTGLWGQSLTGPNSSFQEPNLKKQNSRGSLCVSPLWAQVCPHTHTDIWRGEDTAQTFICGCKKDLNTSLK